MAKIELKVPLFKNPHLQTEEGQAELLKLTKQREELDYECYQLWNEFQSGHWFEELLEHIHTPGDSADLQEFRERVEDVLSRRSDLTNKIIELVIG